jgi:hypothetical protein
MLASPLPIYLGCAGLIVGTLGLGAQHMLGGSSSPSTNTAMEQPLFARSVEQASLPAPQWPSTNVDVAYYGPMVELLTQPTSSTPAPFADPSRVAAPQQQQQPAHDVAPAPQSSSTTVQAQEEPRAAPREVVRDLSPQQSKQTRRAKNQRQRDDARSSDGETASTEQVDPRQARARYRDDADEPRSDRRSRDGERRVVVREEIREPEPRVVRGPEQREVGFSPFRLFGIFDQR